MALLQTERYARVSDVFQHAVELPEQERAEYLARECGSDGPLRQEVEALLAADARDDDFIARPIASLPADLLTHDHDADLTGREFGPYRVIRELGRGGLGAVYLAARADAVYRKEVAIKLIRRGLDTDDILRRFRNERQILAGLDHPNIARLIDGGTTADGLPYFVMEHVEGEPIDRYCSSRELPIAERLAIFRKVCAAVTFAHQHLVIHRDLKPSNILVGADSEPKLLDFGIAKVLTAKEEAFTVTLPEQRLLTREYASPEQIRGASITTTTDVYSLGVLLYELLSGDKPYRLKTGTSEELTRAIAEQEPARQKSLPRDLNHIVRMAMRKEPVRRYSSVEQFSDDIRRYLEGRPVVAHEDSVAYRAGKFVRRNTLGVTAAALVLLALSGGLIATLWQARIANAERAKAERRFNDVRKLANSNLFDVYPEVENLAGSLKAREKILQNALTYLDSLAREAAGDVTLQSELATAYEKVGDVQGAMNTSSLGDAKAGLESYAKAAKLRAAVLQQRPRDVDARDALANNHYTTARTLWNHNQTHEAEEAFERGLQLRRALVAAQPNSVELQNRLAVLLIDYGAIPAFNVQSEKATALFEEALEINHRLRAQDAQSAELKKTRARALRILSKPRAAVGDHAGGMVALEEAHQLSRELAREFPQDFRLQRSVWLTENMMCELLIDKGDGAEAAARCEAIIAFPDAALRNEPENGVVIYDLAISHFNLARALHLTGENERSIEQAEKAVAVMSQLAAKQPDNLDYQRNLAVYRISIGRAQIELGRFGEALAVLEGVATTLRPIIATNPGDTTYQSDLAFTQQLLARALYRNGERGRALNAATEAKTIYTRLRDQNALRASEKTVLQELEEERAEYSR
jgi:tRNA A-37 threonylcarbamoyl transferase component Bud32/tetratricopeptide (TPR) repeat protein